MISKILLALDASERAPLVVATCAVIAARFGATVYPLRAIMVPAEFPAAGAGATHDFLPEVMTKEAENELRALLKPVLDVDFTPPVIRLGEPAHAILTASEELGVDLIVLGSHGYAGWDRVLGTTVGAVSNRASCSVFIVRDSHHPAPTARPSAT